MKHLIALAFITSLCVTTVAETSAASPAVSPDAGKHASLVGAWKTKSETLTVVNKDDFKWTRNGWCMKLPCPKAVELGGTYVQTGTKLIFSSSKRKRDLYCDYTLAKDGKAFELKCKFRNDPKDDDKVTTIPFKRSN